MSFYSPSPLYKPSPHLSQTHSKYYSLGSLSLRSNNKLSSLVIHSLLSSPMARSFANVNTFSALLQGFSNSLTRRGYSVAKHNATRGGVTSVAGKSGEEKRVSTHEVSWVPDPVTGYYKPENINEVDVADLRATLLRKKFNNN